MKCHAKMTKATADTGDIDLPSLVCSLQSRVGELEYKKVHHKPNIRTHSYSNSNNFYRQPSAHKLSFHFISSFHHSSFHQQPSSFNRQSSSQMPVPFDTTHPKVTQHKPSRRQSYSLPTYYRCGQLGHLQIGCRAVLTRTNIASPHLIESWENQMNLLFC